MTAHEPPRSTVTIDRPFHTAGPLSLELSDGVDAESALTALGLRAIDGEMARWEFDGDEDEDELAERMDETTLRYGDHPVLVDFSWHSESGGPVSWDGRATVVEVGAYWVEVFDGDTGLPDVIHRAPEDRRRFMLGWLLRTGAALPLIVKELEPAWTDADLVRPYQAARAGVIGNTVDVSVSDPGLNATDLIAHLADHGGADVAAVIEILRAGEDPRAARLISILTACDADEDAGPLLEHEAVGTSLRAP